ncbi:hypothetical protein JQF37_28500 [Pseudomonas sp. MIL9]|uniref:hypothetical protein n=1 Tax=Pseudomonas sp. MIL9 TaxID=2807620 RepID=UPI00194F61E7|nr:hypothetical protein [Pseudomonas sp. MIL9]MBM6447537.1 hypothetical protein [Pseudomonas sp. MIL9]
MQSYKDTVEDYIKRHIFSETGEAFLDLSIQEDVIYSEFDFVGRMLCQKYIEGDSSFYLLDSVRVQAAAVHGHQAVLVCKGMLDLIFRTSAMMVGAERRQKFPEDEFYEPWRNNLSCWFKNAEFDWSDERYWWLHRDDYRSAFEILAEGLFVFLVLHEIGHLHNLHGDRRAGNSKSAPPSSSSSTDEIFVHEALGGGEAMSEADRLATHTREVIADTYAFQFMLVELRECLLPESEYADRDEGALRALNFGMCIYMVASLFWALSFQRPMRNDTQEDDYPSHLFRLQSIEATSLEHQLCGGNQQMYLGMQIGIKNYTEKLIFAAGDKGFVSWRMTADLPANHEHYQKICEMTDEWSNIKFGVRNEDWLRWPF